MNDVMMASEQRAYSVIKVQSIESDARIIKGIATTPTPDRVGDVVSAEGATFAESIPLLRGHMRSEPVGRAHLGKPTSKGIPFSAHIVKVDEPGPLRDRVETAWLEVKSGLVSAVSIGFRPLTWSYRDDGGVNFDELEIYELSLVTIPANAQAVITSIKSFGDPLSRDAVDAIRRIERSSGAVRLSEKALQMSAPQMRGAVLIR